MKSKEKGFSLIEVLVASVVFAIISGAVVILLNQSQYAFRSQREFNQAGTEARMALHHIVRTIRQAGNDPLDALEDSGAEAIEILGSRHFRVNSDITGSIASTSGNPKEKTGEPDGELDAVYEVVEYRYDNQSNRLMVDVGYGETVLASDIVQFGVRYFDSDGNETTTSSEIVRVRILVVGSSAVRDARTGRKNRISLRSDIWLRSKSYDLYSLS